MIFKYDVEEINILMYIVGSQLVSERGAPSKDYEFSEAFGKELAGENGRPQWTIRDNPDYDLETDPIDSRYLIENNPIPLKPEEIEAEKQQKIEAEIRARLPGILLNLTGQEGFETVIQKIAEIKQGVKVAEK